MLTEFADTYQEANGLLWPDRRPTMPIEEIALAVRGSRGVGVTGAAPWQPQLDLASTPTPEP